MNQLWIGRLDTPSLLTDFERRLSTNSKFRLAEYGVQLIQCFGVLYLRILYEDCIDMMCVGRVIMRAISSMLVWLMYDVVMMYYISTATTLYVIRTVFGVL